MGNPDIRDIIEHVDQNKNQSLDPKEWKLISELFDVQAKELKPDAQTTISGDKFMTDQEKTQISLQEKMKENIKKENKETISYNKNINSLKKSLENPKTVTKLLDMIWSRIQMISNKDDIQYFQNFLDTVNKQLQVTHETELPPLLENQDKPYDVLTQLQSQLWLLQVSLDEKNNSLLQINSSSTNISNISTNIENSPWITQSSESLQNQLEQLSDKDFVKFRQVIENLSKNGKVSLEQLDPLDSMTQILKQVASLDKNTVKNVVETVMKEKFSWQENSKELITFKEIFYAILDRKDILNSFVTIVDKDIKWLSYDELLMTQKFESADVKKSINTIFHRNEGLFNTMTNDFLDPIKQPQVEKIVKEYVKLSVPDIDLNNAHVGMTEVSVNGKQKKAFQLLDTSGNAMTITKKNEKWENIQVPLTPFFWDSQKWEIISLQDCVSQNQWVKDALKIWPDNMKQLNPELQELMKKTIETASWKKVSISEAISWFFNSPLFDEIKKIFLMLGMFSKEGMSYWANVDIALIDSKKSFRNLIQSSNFGPLQKELNIASSTEALEKFNSYPWYYKEEYDANSKLIKINNYQNSEKEYFTTLSPENQLRYLYGQKTNLKNSKWQSIPKWSDKRTADGIKKDSIVETNTSQETKKQSIDKEFISGWEYKELSLDGTKPGKVEKIDTDKNNPYLKIDGQVIPLINGKWSLFIKWFDGQIIEKVISFDKKDNKENISIIDGEKLDMWLLEKIYKEKNISMLWNDEKNNIIKKYYILEQSAEWKNNIDQFMKSTSELPIDQKNKIEQIISIFKKWIYQSIWKTPDNKLITLHNDLKKSLLDIKLPIESQQNERNTTVNKRIQSMWS